MATEAIPALGCLRIGLTSVGLGLRELAGGWRRSPRYWRPAWGALPYRPSG
jgi:hypothetical protein